MTKIFIEKLDEVFCIVYSEDRGVLAEIHSFFSFFAPNYKFHPKYKAKFWDGRISLYSNITGKFYIGLIPHLRHFCAERNYEVEIDNKLVLKKKTLDFDDFISSLNLKYTPYDTQKHAITVSIEERRRLLLSPVNSGKSLIIYCISRFLLNNTEDKILIVVPSVSLVHQMFSDFQEYCETFDVSNVVHKIFEGQPKQSEKRIFLTTFQSIMKLPKHYFEQFGALIIDEAHMAKSTEIKNIAEKCINASYRIGTTGTLDNIDVNKRTIEGLTGLTLEVTTQKQLIENGISSNIDIDCLLLEYDKAIAIENKNMAYQEELKFIIHNEKRNRLIANICKVTPDDKNIIIFTQHINHIKNIKKQLESVNIGREIIIFTGEVDTHVRERERKSIDSKSGIIMLATYGAASTGLNIKNLQLMIMASPSKSQIRVLQTIGRLLRRDGKDNNVKLIDIADSWKYGGKQNILLRHLIERVKIYTKEKFSYKVKKIQM